MIVIFIDVEWAISENEEVHQVRYFCSQQIPLHINLFVISM